MYAATLEPLLHQCNEAIEMAKIGAIDDARVCLDRIRFLRSLLAQNKGNGEPSPTEQANVMAQSPALLQRYIEVATSVNQRLETIHQWITQSRASFSIEELRQSHAGMNLFVDDALPGIWDFKQDIVLLTDLDGEVIREVLRARGQSKFIWMTHSVPCAGEDSLDSSASDTLFVVEGQYPEKADIEAFLNRFSVPRAALITTNASARDEQNFHTVARSIGSAVIAGSTTQWLPQATAEQWLESTPTLAKLPTVMALKAHFDGADVLVVSPGPSLKQDLELLSEVQDQFLIFASVKALSALFDAGIKPDLAIWQDPRDHSHAIPDRPEIAEVGLVLSEGCHPAFFEAGFATHFPYPDPGFVGTELSAALHGDDAPKIGGTSVSTLSAVMALEFNARSVTLLGQDLSIGGGLYVSGGSPTEEEALSQDGYLTCQGINGEELPTLPNYYAFIGEFQNIAHYYQGRVPLYNSTASGAFLEGWKHLPFANHPLVKNRASKGSKPDIAAKFRDFQPRFAIVHSALQAMVGRLDHAAKICDEIQKECLEKIQSGSNDCTVIDLLEQRLKLIFDDECPLLKYYTSRQSMALNAATESVQNLEQNLRVSADYYDSIAQASRQLITLCETSIADLGRAQENAGA